MTEEPPDGCIDLDTPFAKSIGFTSDKFHGKFAEGLGGSYMWKDGKQITVSLIHSKYPGKGNLRAMIETLEKLGYNVWVPTPSNRMIDILTRMGFVLNLNDIVDYLARPNYTPRL